MTDFLPNYPDFGRDSNDCSLDLSPRQEDSGFDVGLIFFNDDEISCPAPMSDQVVDSDFLTVFLEGSSSQDGSASVYGQGGMVDGAVAPSTCEFLASVQARLISEPVIYDTPAEILPLSFVMDAADSENDELECSASPVPAGPRPQPARKRRAEEPADCDGELALPKRKKNRREQDIIATLRHLHAERMLLDLQFTGSKLARIEFDPKWHKRAIDELNKHVICKKNDLQSSSAGVPRHNLREFFRYAKVLPQSRRGTRHRDWENSCVWEIVDAAPVHYAAALQRGVQPLC
eukprot:CAMPEP_0181315670 /NCGR_PEP_ID=MMETSP1101-20121128/15498_1 /TAXON_ID=46948 /ORGANISM="Rhodomonas abbreviata, Strain Caron Lab Isolate" /LENGTH=289 /DNA_ID=CAMNT_0023422891 /DNA_START=226 /DNA_END=1095 /DNA_ORIENTATION=+